MSEKDIAFFATKIDQLNQRMKFVEDNSIAGLRDFFATSALSVLGSNVGYSTDTDTAKIAKFCYSVADSMMKEREKK